MTINRQAFEDIANQAMHLDVFTDEAKTCQYLIMPFFSALGYNVFSSAVFVPEYTADWGKNNSTKADYAIMRNGKVAIIVEAKKRGEGLHADKERQLAHYFATTEAKIGILTDGVIYRLYSDLEKPNIMDQVPFYELDIRQMDDKDFEELNHLSEDEFDFDRMIKRMQERNRVNGIIDYFKQQLDGEPDKDFVKFLMKIVEPNVTQTAIRVHQFGPTIQHALKQLIGVEVSDDDIKPPDHANAATAVSRLHQQVEVSDDDIKPPDPKPPPRKLSYQESLAFCYYSLMLGIHGYSNPDIGRMLAEIDFLDNRNAKIHTARVWNFFQRNSYTKITGISGKGPNTDPDILREAAERVQNKINNELDAETADRIFETYQRMLTQLQEPA